MIRENNTLEWQETAEHKRVFMMTMKQRKLNWIVVIQNQ